ncbi:MAG: DNA-directed RNA polymerase subunit D [Halobacteriales archaeon]
MAEDFDVEFIDRDDRNARFVVRGLTPAFANGVRRAMLADVPTMAIDTVRITENTSVMFDEMVGLRLGLVPMTTPPGEFEPGDSVTLALDVEGPATAYSGDIESSDPQVGPADDNIPIIELKEGQRLAFEAEAVLGRGRDHAKHQGGVAVGYRHLQRVEVDGELDEYEDREPHIVRGVVEIDGELVPAEEFGNDVTNRFPERAVTVEDVPGAFVFHVETDGSMSIDDLVTGAVRSLSDRADELEAAVQL